MEAQVYVYDLDLFVTVQLLEETPAVLSLGKLCDDHGCSCEWVSGQKPRLTKKGKTVIHQFWEQFVVNIDIAGFVFNKSSSRVM